jgi:hypothetical protein
VRKYVLRKKDKYEMKIIDGKKVLYVTPPEWTDILQKV